MPLPASKRTRALLGFLVAADSAKTRQSLCDLLWDGPDDPRAALRWSLTKLRDVVDDNAHVRLVADRERVAFRAHGTEVDVATVQGLLAGGVEQAGIAALEAAAPLLSGEFLDGLDLPACHRFHHWCMAERERFGAMRRHVLSALIELLGDDAARALPHARALVTADPLSEVAHATLIRVLTRCGRQQDAAIHCERTADFLGREVGLEAAGALRAALRDARRKRLGSPKGRVASPEPAAPGRPGRSRDLVGRNAEWQRVLEITDRLATPQRMLLILGEPGIGKSRLLEALSTVANNRGARVASGRCFEAETVHPYGCFADALRELPETLVPEELRNRLSRATAGQPPRIVDGSDRRQLHDRIAQLVRTLADSSPFILVLDDLQWVDEASAALLHFMARSAVRGLLLAGAARPGELDDNPWAKRLIDSLMRDGLLERCSLEPLSSSDIAVLTHLEFGSEEATAIFRYSGGNPLLALELAHAHEKGSELHGQSLGTLVADRVARLSEDERDVLVWAAAFGRAVHPELLAACLGLRESVQMTRLNRLVRHGLLRPNDDGQLDFTHDLVRQEVYRLQSQPHRRVLHRQIARVLSAVVDESPDFYGDLVRHAGLAEDHATAVRACIAAAERCLRLFAGAQARETADRGLAHLEHLPAGKERIRQHVKLLELRLFASFDEAPLATSGQLPALEHATDAAVIAGLFTEAVAMLHARSWVYQRLSDSAGAKRMTLQAEKISRTADTATRCRQLANTGRCLLDVEASIGRALSLVAEAEIMADAHNLQFVELEWARALGARWRGDLEAAAEFMARALAYARLGEDHWREAQCLVWLATIELERGNLDRLDSLCNEGVRLLSQVDRSSLPALTALRALGGLHRAEPTAAAAVAASLAALHVVDDKWRLAYVLNCQAASALEGDDLRVAAAAAADALANATIVQRPTEMAVATAILAQINARAGDAQQAAVALEDIRTLIASEDVGARGRTLLQQAETAIIAHIPTLAHTMIG